MFVQFFLREIGIMAKPLSRNRRNYSVRFSPPERSLLETAAAQRGEYLSEFIRRTTLSAATKELAGGCQNDFERVSDILPRALAEMGYDLGDLLAANRQPSA
jgi:hypothetical protein